VDACLVAAHLVGRWSGDVNARGRGAMVGCEDSRPDSPNGAEDPRNLVSPGSKKFQADQRLDGGAIAGGLR
jgi:hypothetical protein